MNVVVSQALATGLPVIVTGHSGLPEQVINGVNGLVVPEGQPAELADKILQLIEEPNQWAELGRAGRRHALAHYDSRRLMDQQVSDYRRLSGSP